MRWPAVTLIYSSNYILFFYLIAVTSCISSVTIPMRICPEHSRKQGNNVKRRKTFQCRFQAPSLSRISYHTWHPLYKNVLNHLKCYVSTQELRANEFMKRVHHRSYLPLNKQIMRKPFKSTVKKRVMVSFKKATVQKIKLLILLS